MTPSFHMCGVTHSCGWHDAFTPSVVCRMNAMCVCDMTHFTYVTWLIHVPVHMFNTTHFRWHEAFMYVTCCIHTIYGVPHESHICVCDMTHFTCVTCTRPYVWHDSFQIVAWHIHACDMKQSHHNTVVGKYSHSSVLHDSHTSPTCTKRDEQKRTTYNKRDHKKTWPPYTKENNMSMSHVTHKQEFQVWFRHVGLFWYI